MSKDLKVVVYYLCQLQKNTHPVTLGQVDKMQLYTFILFRILSPPFLLKPQINTQSTVINSRVGGLYIKKSEKFRL